MTVKPVVTITRVSTIADAEKALREMATQVNQLAGQLADAQAANAANAALIEKLRKGEPA